MVGAAGVPGSATGLSDEYDTDGGRRATSVAPLHLRAGKRPHGLSAQQATRRTARSELSSHADRSVRIVIVVLCACRHRIRLTAMPQPTASTQPTGMRVSAETPKRGERTRRVPSPDDMPSHVPYMPHRPHTAITRASVLEGALGLLGQPTFFFFFCLVSSSSCLPSCFVSSSSSVAIARALPPFRPCCGDNHAGCGEPCSGVDTASRPLRAQILSARARAPGLRPPPPLPPAPRSAAALLLAPPAATANRSGALLERQRIDTLAVHNAMSARPSQQTLPGPTSPPVCREYLPARLECEPPGVCMWKACVYVASVHDTLKLAAIAF